MGRWVRVDDYLIQRVLKVRAEGISWAQIQRRFGISDWTLRKIIEKPRKQEGGK